MNIVKNIKITLSPEDIGEIVVNYLLKEGYDTTINDIVFLTSRELKGYMMDEHYVTRFDGCEINVKDNKR